MNHTLDNTKGKYFILQALFLLLLQVSVAGQMDYTSLVNPFIGTGGHGHTYPGASMPFGMMQLSPDTRLEGWDGCSGYHYSDSLIYGFSHMHLSGTGIPDYCDILVMPFTGEVQWKNQDYASPFSHETENAAPGFYEVLLEKHNIHAQFTTATRSGIHEYTFEKPGMGKVLLDLQHRDQVLDASLEIMSPYEVGGMRRSSSWAKDQVIYFYIKFEYPIKEYGIALDDELKKGLRKATGTNIKSYFAFALPEHRKLRLKIGISGVSIANAKHNLETEITDFNFSKQREKARTAWNKELGKIEVKGGTKDQQVAFYTALYHASLSPNIYTDVNGEYRGTDAQVHHAQGFTNYSVFSLWDTHRALHPLQSVINRRRTGDWIQTFLTQYQQGGMLPMWELSGNETFCMIGYHSVPVIVDAYQKGIRNFDAGLALEAMTNYAESDRFGLTKYAAEGYVSNEVDHESASKTVEYAYDDWCIAQLAGWLGETDIRDQYLLRAQNYKNVFDPNSGFIRGKVHSFWYSPFRATEVNNFYTEGNAWHYSFTAQQDLDGLMELYGGPGKMAEKLDELFTTSETLTGREQSDVTGLIGQYAHGNEPSHHIAYLFDYVGKAWRTQEIVHQICTEFYPNQPDGLIGNEDCGQMSAWLIWSDMGFYPVTPGSGIYAIGSPLFDEVKLHLENGKAFTITAERSSPEDFYINGMQLNGRDHKATYLKHSDIAEGGELHFVLASTPNKSLGSAPEKWPHSGIDDHSFLAVPYFDMEDFKFSDQLEIVLKSQDEDAEIFYSLSDQDDFQLYTAPFVLDKTTTVKAYAVRNKVKSPVISQQFYRVPTDRSIDIQSKVHHMYTAGGEEALIDGLLGTTNWKTGEWQSYFDQNFVAVIDLKAIRPISEVGIHVLQEVNSWILYPASVTFEISDDGEHYQLLTTIPNSIDKTINNTETQFLQAEVSAKARYVKVKAASGGILPDWHESAGNPSHLFIDEVIVR